ncbi:MAG TPA: hypothetical protein ENN17_10840 [bacterium]|nr:hypothetical protein [bacterium]
MEKPNLSSKPPSPKTLEELEAARRRFIAGGEDRAGDPDAVDREIFPWEAPYVRQDVRKLFSLRLSEPDMLKLRYIHRRTGKSMHQFCLDAVLPAIETEISKLTEGE